MTDPGGSQPGASATFTPPGDPPFIALAPGWGLLQSNRMHPPPYTLDPSQAEESVDIPPFAVDARAAFPDPSRQRTEERIDTIAIHRAGGSKWPRRTERLIETLHPHWKTAGLGNGIPYWAFVEDTGRTVIVSDWWDVGAHAGRWNTRALGIAVVGDFRTSRQKPTKPAVVAVINLCAWAVERFGLDAESVRGHSELPGATQHPKKVCPGPNFPLETVRAALVGLAAG